MILDGPHGLVWKVMGYTISNPLVFISNFVNPFWEWKGQVSHTVQMKFCDVCHFPQSVLETEFYYCPMKKLIQIK